MLTGSPLRSVFEPFYEPVADLQSEVDAELVVELGLEARTVPRYDSSLLCYLPFWIKPHDSFFARRVCKINLFALHAGWLLEEVMDSEAHSTRVTSLIPLLPILGAKIAFNASTLPNGARAIERLGCNSRALIREKRTEIQSKAFVPYSSIWTKFAFAMFTADAAESEPPVESALLRFLALFQMLDEFVDLFQDLQTGAHNDLAVRLHCSRPFVPDETFFTRYARHGERLAVSFERLGRKFEQLGSTYLGGYCSERAAILQDRYSTVRAFVPMLIAKANA